jgi:hypothetical protein
MSKPEFVIRQAGSSGLCHSDSAESHLACARLSADARPLLILRRVELWRDVRNRIVQVEKRITNGRLELKM